MKIVENADGVWVATILDFVTPTLDEARDYIREGAVGRRASASGAPIAGTTCRSNPVQRIPRIGTYRRVRMPEHGRPTR
jgi:hypothetical protein